MANQKHSPGLWEVDGHCVVNDEGLCVADCSDEDFGKTEEQAEADARLICAANNLLDSSKRLMDVLWRYYPQAYREVAAKDLTEAIAKAEGK